MINPPEETRRSSRRQSIAFFHNPNRDAQIVCLDVCSGPGDPPKYEPVLYDTYARLKYRQTHGADLK